jgi:hypothetical protein
MKHSLRSLLLACVLLLLAAVPASGTSCAEGILSDGRFLVAIGPAPAGIPPGDGEVEAAVPACNGQGDDDPDRPTKATKLRGIPADVAVRRAGKLYVAWGTLVPVRSHPLRDVIPYDGPRRLGRCRRERLRGPSHPLGRFVDVRGRTVIVDRRTRITNRPAHQPVGEGQRLAIQVSRCGRRRFADAITFLAPIKDHRAEPDFGGPLERAIPYLILLGLPIAAGAIVAGAVRRA